jgi:MoaA/NifB/PqqE/SkfB family radical SAM enzyme
VDLELRPGPELVLRLQRAGGSGRIDLIVDGPEARGAVWRAAHAAIRYSADFAALDEQGRAELRALIVQLGTVVERWLSAHQGRSVADFLAAQAAPARRLVFGPAALLELLAPEVTLGADLAEGWRLDALYPSSHLSESVAEHLSLVAELVHPVSGRLRLEVGKRNDRAHAFARSEHFDVSYLTLGSAPDPSATAVVRWLGLLLRLRDSPALEVEFPLASEDAAAIERRLAPPGARSAEWLNLALDAPCGQSCAFCSALDVSPPWRDDDESRLARALADLRSHHAAGVRKLRLNGYDPLAFPRLLELAAEVRRLGYERVSVYSPCTRLADPAVLDELLRALPDHVVFYVPIYGPTAPLHDAVVGTPGAFVLVRRALAHLVARLPAGRVIVSSVAVSSNLDGLLALRDWVRDLGVTLRVQTPYPSSESPRDRFHECAASFDAIARATMPDAAREPLVVDGVPPCVYWRRGRELGLRAADWLVVHEPRRPLPGREYAHGSYVHRALPVQNSAFVASAVACPHEDRCALRDACPREILRSYADQHGLDELRPVALPELLRETR